MIWPSDGAARRRWTNVWHSSAIRSTLYMLNAPFRGMAGLFHGGR